MTNISIRQRTIVDKSANERIHRLKSVSRDSFIYFLVVCFAALCILDSYNHLHPPTMPIGYELPRLNGG
ncbi:unnamed protein product [Rotaria sp. Silwood1]|nr:unnamed protein product [Rotaria sp. Silwood1]